MKPNTAAHILLISPLLVSLCFAMPAQAVVQPIPQAMVLSAIEPSIKTSAHPPRRTSFYQQQLDKLKYTPESLLQSRDVFSQQRRNKQQNTQPPITAATADKLNQNDEKKEPPSGRLGTTDTNSRHPNNVQIKDKAKTRQAIKERIQQQVQTQKRNLTSNQSPISPPSVAQPAKDTDSGGHRNPHDILAAAKQKHSPLQGNHLNIESFSTDKITHKINVRKPNFAPIKQQIPETIDQLKADLRSTIQQQPEQLQRALTAAKTDLQQRSAQKIDGPLNSLNTFIQRNLKDPLSHLLRKVGIAAQTTAEQLQKSD